VVVGFAVVVVVVVVGFAVVVVVVGFAVVVLVEVVGFAVVEVLGAVLDDLAVPVLDAVVETVTVLEGAGGGGTKVSLQNPVLLAMLFTSPLGWG
jgi:hypothetical protein